MVRHGWKAAGLVLLVAGLLASCSSTPQAIHPTGSTGSTVTTASTTTTTVAPTTTTTEPPPLPAGVQGTVSQIPWGSVGPGWLLALWSPNAASTQIPPPSTTAPAVPIMDSLFLVDPAGGRYLVTSVTPDQSLVSWSGDGRRALLDSGNAPMTLTQIDLPTGNVVSTFQLAQSGSPTYTRPQGLAVLVESNGIDRAPNSLQRFSLTGTSQLVYPDSFSQVGAFSGSFLSSPDGTQILMGGASGLALVSNSGTVVSQIPTPGLTYCQLTRWWATNVALASCSTANTLPRLWEIPIAGGSPTALTAPPVNPDNGDLNGWQTPSGVYVQAAGGCGAVYLAKVQPDSTTAPVTVPDANPGYSQFVLGTTGNMIALHATVGCGPGVSLLWFDASTTSSSVVLGPPINGGSVVQALSYPDPNG